MNAKPVVFVLAVIALLLAAGLVYRHSTAVKHEETASAAILQLSNQWVQTKDHLAEQERVNSTLSTNLDVRAEELKAYSNNLAILSSNLAKTEADAKAAAKAAQEEMAKRDTRINELESQKDDLTKRMSDLNGSITTLEAQISDTQRKLAASEGDREFLLKELKRLQNEKADLERQFNDLAMLREQVHKIKDELSISRRLDWIRRGLYGNMMKGAERLQKGNVPPVPGSTSSNFDLNVDLNQSGGVKVNPPGTNSPATPPK